jgi:putative nucleotidyltransferase with HDIG domain
MNFAEHLRQNDIFSLIAQCGKDLGFPTYLIGGYVRDLLLKRPCKDIDVVCLGSGIELAELIAKKLQAKKGENIQVHTFKNFGTAMVQCEDMTLEFVGARKESYRHESRKPIVENGTLEDDQNRRDFTINALAISLCPHDYGTLIDPFNGLKDMEKKIIRTPLEPDITFSDDPLRMMRAIRFATQLNYDIDGDTFQAISKNKDRLKIVSQERIIDELNKIIMANTPSYGFKLLHFSGLLEYILPEFIKLKGVETIDGKSHKDNFFHTLIVLDNTVKLGGDLWLRWSALLHDIAKPATKRFDPQVGWTFHGHEDKGARMVPNIFRRLKLPMDNRMLFVQKLVRMHLRPIALVKDSITDAAIRRLIFDAGDDIDALMKLCRADITSKDDKKVKVYLERFSKLEKRIVEVEQTDQVRNFQPVITGEIIMETFGLQPSKPVGIIKDEIREAILDGKIRNDFEQSYNYMLLVAKRLNLQVVKPKEQLSIIVNPPTIEPTHEAPKV